MDSGLCILICSLTAPRSLAAVLTAVGESRTPPVDVRVAVISSPQARARAAALVAESPAAHWASCEVSPRQGFSSSRRYALRWVREQLPGYAVLFLDDDDVPEREMIQRLWSAHLHHPTALVAGRVLSPLRRASQGQEAATSIVRYHTASGLLLPSHLLAVSETWLPVWLDHCGGEDTALCASAGSAGIRIVQVGSAVAREYPLHGKPSQRYLFRRSCLDAWIFSSLCRKGVIDGWRGATAVRLISAVTCAVRALLVVGVDVDAALRHSGQAVGTLCGLIFLPPPRSWLGAKRAGADAP
jgi:hypothetical protein